MPAKLKLDFDDGNTVKGFSELEQFLIKSGIAAQDLERVAKRVRSELNFREQDRFNSAVRQLATEYEATAKEMEHVRSVSDRMTMSQKAQATFVKHAQDQLTKQFVPVKRAISDEIKAWEELAVVKAKVLGMELITGQRQVSRPGELFGTPDSTFRRDLDAARAKVRSRRRRAPGEGQFVDDFTSGMVNDPLSGSPPWGVAGPVEYYRNHPLYGLNADQARRYERSMNTRGNRPPSNVTWGNSAGAMLSPQGMAGMSPEDMEALIQQYDKLYASQEKVTQSTAEQAKQVGILALAWKAWAALDIAEYAVAAKNALQTVTDQSTWTGKAIQTGITAMLRLGPAVLAVTAVYKGYQKILSMTGHELKLVTNATDEQKRMFRFLQLEAAQAGTSVADMASRLKIDLKEAGLEASNNLDKFNKSLGRLGHELSFADDLEVAKEGIKGWWYETNIFYDLWKEVDERVTKDVKGMTEEWDRWSEAIKRNKNELLYGEKGVDLSKQIADQKEMTKRIEETNAKRMEQFSIQTRATKDVETFNKQLKESQRIGKMDVKEQIAFFKDKVDNWQQEYNTKVALGTMTEEMSKAEIARYKELKTQHEQLVETEKQRLKVLGLQAVEQAKQHEYARQMKMAMDRPVNAAGQTFNQQQHALREQRKAMMLELQQEGLNQRGVKVNDWIENQKADIAWNSQHREVLDALDKKDQMAGFDEWKKNIQERQKEIDSARTGLFVSPNRAGGKQHQEMLNQMQKELDFNRKLYESERALFQEKVNRYETETEKKERLFELDEKNIQKIRELEHRQHKLRLAQIDEEYDLIKKNARTEQERREADKNKFLSMEKEKFNEQQRLRNAELEDQRRRQAFEITIEREKAIEKQKLVEEQRADLGGKSMMQRINEELLQNPASQEAIRAELQDQLRQRMLSEYQARFGKGPDRAFERAYRKQSRQLDRHLNEYGVEGINEDEVNKALSEVGGRLVDVAEASGQLSKDVADGLRAAMNAAKEQAEAAIKSSEEIKQIKIILDEIATDLRKRNQGRGF